MYHPSSYWLLASAFAWQSALAQNDQAQPPSVDVATLDRVEVRSSRLDGVASFDVPASISHVGLENAGSTMGITDALGSVPGVLARDRQNLAQDTQLSIRGFGSRASFGVRGVRLYADGIPATMPDGQGQLSHFNLEAADRIEIMRGPFSALYGNSSGGVVQMWSAVGQGSTQTQAQAIVGSRGASTLAARMRGEIGGIGYNVAASSLDTDGYRDHSHARRELGNLKVRIPLRADGRLDVVANYFNSPHAQDPLGLTRSQVERDPRQATPEAHLFNTRKSARQRQLGALWEQPLGHGHTLRASAYAGDRAIEQILALPVAAQSNPLNSGGLIDLDSHYSGVDLRWSWRGLLAGRRAELSVGLATDEQRQHRLGFENFAGAQLGVRGRLRREERNDVDNVDEYAQLWWEFSSHWSLLVGLRHSRVQFEANDDYITGSNPDDSGQVRYTQSMPVAGLVYAPTQNLRLYGSMGRGFETPTFNELSYRSDGGAGLAFDLVPAISQNAEVGVKWRSGRGTVLTGALFRAVTDDEIAVARNVGGRSSYRNVGRARRQGVEVSALVPVGSAGTLEFSYSRLDAEFRDSFPMCTTTGCTSPNAWVNAGTRIPGLARDQLTMRATRRIGAWTLGGSVQAVGEVSVNDRGSEVSPGFAIVQLEATRQFRVRYGDVHVFARIDNALDQSYIGSVIVNEGNGRYYEPGPDRSFQVGARWVWAR